MPSNSPSREDQAIILAESKRFRDFLMKTGMRWSRRSGIRRAADTVCDELDELAMVITGNRDALLDPLHKTPRTPNGHFAQLRGHGAFTNEYDRALIISADSDLGPAIKTVQAHFPEKSIDVIAPPGRLAHARDLSPLMQITKGRVAKCLLSATATRPDGSVIFARPTNYDLPAPSPSPP